MNNNTDTDKTFSEWAGECYKEHPEIINHWNEGKDPFKRAMAIRIIDVAGGVVNES